MATDKLQQRFIQGLQNYNLSIEEIKSWTYCGSSGSAENRNYFKVCFPEKELPTPSPTCVCGHGIVENCYITNGETILVLGSCCVKKFMKIPTRSCMDCGAVHKRRISSKCFDCDKGSCRHCFQECESNKNICKTCQFIGPPLSRTCDVCKEEFKTRKEWQTQCDICFEKRFLECDNCSEIVRTYVVKKEGPNKGRLFYKCSSCFVFKFLS